MMLLQELLEETPAPKFILYGEKLLIHLKDYLLNTFDAPGIVQATMAKAAAETDGVSSIG